MDDGIYNFFIKNEAGEWIKSEQPLSEYTLYGSYMVTQYMPTRDKYVALRYSEDHLDQRQRDDSQNVRTRQRGADVEYEKSTMN